MVGYIQGISYLKMGKKASQNRKKASQNETEPAAL
jgi:hypothetical protein